MGSKQEWGVSHVSLGLELDISYYPAALSFSAGSLQLLLWSSSCLNRCSLIGPVIFESLLLLRLSNWANHGACYRLDKISGVIVLVGEHDWNADDITEARRLSKCLSILFDQIVVGNSCTATAKIVPLSVLDLLHQTVWGIGVLFCAKWSGLVEFMRSLKRQQMSRIAMIEHVKSQLAQKRSKLSATLQYLFSITHHNRFSEFLLQHCNSISRSCTIHSWYSGCSYSSKGSWGVDGFQASVLYCVGVGLTRALLVIIKAEVLSKRLSLVTQGSGTSVYDPLLERDGFQIQLRLTAFQLQGALYFPMLLEEWMHQLISCSGDFHFCLDFFHSSCYLPF